MPTLASDFALRTPASAAPTAASIAGSPPAGTSSAVGQAARCTEPSCVQDQTSSVTYGRIGASSRRTTSSAIRSVARALAAAASPWAP